MSSEFAADPAVSSAGLESQAKKPIASITFLRKNLLRQRDASGTALAGCDRLLEDAEYLLKYACRSGIELDEKIVQTIISAGAAPQLSSEETVTALAAVTTLAEKLKPVSAETLRACEHQAQHTIQRYWKYSLLLGVPLIILSLLSFLANGLTKSITDDITRANALAIALIPVMQTPPTEQANKTFAADQQVVANLQQFAAVMRDSEAKSHQLGYFILTFDKNRKAAEELQIQLPIVPIREVIRDILTYQTVRDFATQIQDRTASLYGAVSSIVLPPLYAVLGALAYLLRSISEQVRLRTFTPSPTDTARFMIAAIGGGVVGLFSNFTLGQGSVLSPLAIAFLVGYATDVFFSFLDGVQQTKSKSI
jgi:hypothetical protein